MDLFSNIDLLFVSLSSISFRVFRFISCYQSKTTFTRPVVEKLWTNVLLIFFLARIIAAGQVHNPAGHSGSQPLRQNPTNQDRSPDQYPVPDNRAYCEDDTFNVSCKVNEVITIASAAFGRMGTNRCFSFQEKEFLNFDVKSEIEMECSGMQKCSFFVNEIQKKYRWCFRTSNRCLLDLDYTCLPVNDPPRCDGQQLLTQSGTLSSARYLSDFSTEDRPDVVCPWTIRVPSNHWINLTLEDFSQENRSVEYGTVTENGHNSHKPVKIYGGKKGVTWIRVSEGSSVNVTINLTAVANHRFLIHYTVVGCPPIMPIRDSWIENLDKFNAIIHCNSTRDHWQLKCVGTTWIGNTSDNRTCAKSTSESAIPPSDTSNSDQSNGSPPQVGMVLAMGVAIGIAVGVLILVGITYFMRRKKKRSSFDCNPDPAVIADHTLKSCKYSCGSLAHMEGPYSCNMSIHTPEAGLDRYGAWTWHQSRPYLNNYSSVDDIYHSATVRRPIDSVTPGTNGYRPAQFHRNPSAVPIYPLYSYPMCTTPTINMPFQYPEGVAMGPRHSPMTDRRGVRAQNSFRDVQERNPPSMSNVQAPEAGASNAIYGRDRVQPQTPTTPVYFQLDPNLTREEVEIESEAGASNAIYGRERVPVQPQTPTTPVYFQLDPNLTREVVEIE